MVCKKCQKRIRKDAPVCPYCATPQNETVKLGAMSGAGKKKGAASLTTSERLTVILSWVVAILLIAGAAWLWMWATLEPPAALTNPVTGDFTTEFYERGIRVLAVAMMTCGVATFITGFLAIAKVWKQILVWILASVLLLNGVAFMYAGSNPETVLWQLFGSGDVDDNINNGIELDIDNLGINPDLGVAVGEDGGLPKTGVINIALFGLDNRKDADNGRSDAIIILSIDRTHNKIKMTSIARDTMANVEGYGWNDNSRDDDWTKLTHAFYHGANTKGKTGPGAAVKALNENFGLNITKYAYVNFHEFAKIVDLVGGVEIDVQQRELAQLNKHIRGMVSGSGMKIKELTRAGKQNLSGGQALAYARLRKIDTDIQRGNRQKAVIEGVLKKARKMSFDEYPNLIREALSIVNSNLTGSDVIDLARWVYDYSPTMESLSMPDDEGRLYSWDSYSSKNSNAYKWYGSVYILDLDYASAVLRDFIYETNEAKVLTPHRLTLPEIPEHLKRLIE